MRERIVKFLGSHGALVQPEALDYLSDLDDPVDQLKRGLGRGGEVPFVLTLDHARVLTGAQPSRSGSEPAVERGPGPATGRAQEAAGARRVAGHDQAPRRAEDPRDPGPAERPHGGKAAAGAATAAPTTPVVAAAAATVAVVRRPSTTAPSVPRAPVLEPSIARQQAPDRQPATVSRVGVGPAPSTFRQEVRHVAAEVEVLMDITGESTCEGDIEDFHKLFRDRYNRIRKLFRNRREMVGATSINRIREGQPVKIVGVVTDVKTTPNGHRILEIEDDTGECVVLAPKSEHRLLELADELMLDEVVGILGKMTQGRGGKRGLVILEELVRPDLPLDREPNTGGPGSMLVVSDVHLGSDTFLQDGWDALVDWLRGRIDQHRDVASDVKYLVINGDLVEGVGIYPGQDKELTIGNVFDQYKEAARAINSLPDDLSILLLPGNHDAVRPAEPQPGFPEAIAEMYNDNVRILGNPCMVSLSGVEVLCYHGVALFDFFEALPHCNINRPIPTMVEMLRRRHLCPIYGGKTPLAPEHRDLMVIDRVPDVFITGHVHAAQTGEYRGTQLINASTWQAQTSYQRMLGFEPDPCKAFHVDLATLATTTYTFEAEADTGRVRVGTADVSVRGLASSVPSGAGARAKAAAGGGG